MTQTFTESPVRLRRIAADPLTWVVRAVVVIGVANVVVLLAQARAVIRGIYTNADYATSVVLPSLASKAAPGAQIVLGNHAYYQAWWFERVTIGLPFHRQIWELSPFVVEAAGIALLWWCARAAVGRLAGLAVAVLLISMSDTMRSFLFVPAGRVDLTLHIAAFCAALILIREMPDRGPSFSPRIAAVACATIAFGALAATDSLTLVTVIAPFILAPCICWLRDRSVAARRVALFAVTTGVISVVIGLALVSLMESEHIIHSPFPVVFIASSELVSSLTNFVYAWASLGGGSFFGLPVGGASILTAVAGVLALTALAAVCRALYIRGRAWIQDPGASDRVTSVRDLYATYFALVLALTVVMYVATTVNAPQVGTEHYLLGAWVAVAAMLGLLLSSRPAQIAILAGVAVFGLINLRQHVVHGVPGIGVGPDRPTALAISRFAESHGANIGYAEYWDAAPVTWETHLATQVYPVAPCPVTPQAPSGLCDFGIGTISSWYTPRTRDRTFLITDGRTAVPSFIASPPNALGRPIAAAHFGTLTVSIYRYDIAGAVG